MKRINMNISIVGGGPGGLTLARLLQLKGANVNVYERDQSRTIRVQGSTLDLHEDSGLKALEKAGLMEAFKQNYRPGAELMRIVDSRSHIIYDQHREEGREDHKEKRRKEDQEEYQEEASQAFGDAWFRPEIDRGPLRDILLDSLKPGTVIWDSPIEDIAALETDIIVGADGANSKLRKFVTAATPVYSGIMVIEGTVYNAAEDAPRINALTKGGKVFALGDSKTLITSAKGDGSLSFYTGFRKEESWIKTCGLDFNDHKQLLDWFREEYKGWDDAWAELFDNDHTSFIARPQYYMPLDQTWEPRGNITLIGDAAHVMPPYAGEGVNMAMLDALELSECLTNAANPDIGAAIAAYERSMHKRASETARMTLEQTESLHAPGALEHLLQVLEISL